VLILRDVLEYPSAEVARILNTTASAPSAQGLSMRHDEAEAITDQPLAWCTSGRCHQPSGRSSPNWWESVGSRILS
jgi:hypothetical protein